MASTASDLAQQAIDSVNALKDLAENNTGSTGDTQPDDNLAEVYRNEILTDSEFFGFAIEIMTKIQDLLDKGVINTMPVDDQRQLQETLMYITEQQANDNKRRKDGDPAPRTFEEYRNP